MAQGITYPLQLDGKGGLKLESGSALTRAHVLSVIETRPGERILRQDYGLPDMIMDIVNPPAINAKIEAAIERNCPEISNSVVVTGDYSGIGDGVYRVRVEYGAANPISINLTT